MNSQQNSQSTLSGSLRSELRWIECPLREPGRKEMHMRLVIFGYPLNGLRMLRDGARNHAQGKDFPLSSKSSCGCAVSGRRRHGCHRTYGGTKGFRHVGTACRRAEPDRGDRRDGSKYVARATPNGYTLLVARRQHMRSCRRIGWTCLTTRSPAFRQFRCSRPFPNLLVVNPTRCRPKQWRSSSPT